MKKILFYLILSFTGIQLTLAQSTEITPGSILPKMSTAQRTAFVNPPNGMMVFDTNTNSYWFYQSNTWTELASSSSFWELNGAAGNEIKAKNDGGFWSSHSRIIGPGSNRADITTTPINGDGTRYMWLPEMAALRFGSVDDDFKSWDADSIGKFSLANGYNSKAKGNFSIALGEGVTASGEHSFAFGNYSDALDDYTIALGDYAIAKEEGAIAIGSEVEASGYESIAIGRVVRAKAPNAVAIGVGVSAEGSSSVAIGDNVNSIGRHSLAAGFSTYAKAQSATTLGVFNDDQDSPDPIIRTPNDRLFQLGNGAGSSNRSNALTILRNARTGINTVNPTAMLHVNGYTKLGDGAPAIQIKKLTGTMAAGSGGSTSILHGIGNADKILSVDIMVESAVGQWTPYGYDNSNGYRFNYYLDDTRIYLLNKFNEDGLIKGRTFRILIIYEE